ncbi:NAD(P)-dependent oxidoreductase [Salipiger sp. PrR003]|uniref:NAD-dependent epimerase/dehydratase family protein n=1 Tax=Salipiger sp. PrR003 TaxID=2706776 RepID=UPI0013DC1E2B|nr:NAD-dependent epimerase/dehydratase family protein [Salipiger sp. PrR003]NDV49283.1 NAD-dependent epimerase/dehydratase family protein [Salipiger sp. PrR003]
MSLVLVTGGCGFIGRQVVAELIRAGNRVRIYDALIPQVHGSGANPSDLPPEAEVVRGDIQDAPRLSAALRGCETVIHLAAEVGVGQSMYEIVRYVGANDLGTAVLLEAIAEHPVRRLVVASSMSVYGEGYYSGPYGVCHETTRRKIADLRTGLWDPVDEDGARLQPMATDERKRVDLASIYALTKYAQEQSALIFGAAYGVSTVALRLFNVFGAGQALSNPYTGVLANFASRIAAGERPTIFEDGRQQRDFVHVRDVARAFVLATTARDVGGETFNIGSGRPRSILEVATLLARAMGREDLKPELLHRYRAGDIRNCFASIEKAREMLGYVPRHGLEETLPDFVDWVRQEASEDRNQMMRQELAARGLVS